MRDQLCHELSQTGQYRCISMHDARLAPAADINDSMIVARDFEAAFKQVLSKADLVWLIAPECDDILLNLTLLCEDAKVPVIGANADMVSLAADKLKTAAWLAATNIRSPLSLSVPAWQAQGDSIKPSQSWLAKPLKGVGCEGICVLPDDQSVTAWINTQTQASLSRYFLQAEVLQSQPASLSVLCCQGRAVLLSCNRLITEQRDGAILLKQIVVNGFAEHWATFQRLADTIAAQLPDMRAYLGIDVMFDASSYALSVLELNPRLSSSYVGLSKATGQNIAQCLLNAYHQSDFQMPEISHQSVIVNLE